MTEFKDEINIIVDLDRERNVEPKPGRTPNQHRAVIRHSSTVNLAALRAYVEGRMTFDKSVLECISEMNAHVTQSANAKFCQTSWTTCSGRHLPKPILR